MKFICKKCTHKFEIIGKIRKGRCSGPSYVLFTDLIKKAIKCPKCKTANIIQS